MTEQEAEAWATRLTRIWVPEEVTIDLQTLHYLGRYSGPSMVEIKVRPGRAWLGRPSNTHIFILSQVTEESWRPRLGCSIVRGNIKNLSHPQSVHQRELTHHFIAHYLPFFRRGCWLSGGPIEASAHEKIEWMQGFTREEIEVWNLKF